MESSSSGMFVFWNKPQFELSTKLPMIGWGGAFLTFQSLIDHPFTGTSLTEDTASMPVVDRCEEDCSDSGKSCGSSGSSLLLHTSRLLHASFWLSSCFVFLPHATAEIEEDDEEDEGEQCHSSIELWISMTRWSENRSFSLGVKKIYPGSLNQECCLPVYHEANCYWRA